MITICRYIFYVMKFPQQIMFNSKVERSAFAQVNLLVWTERPENEISC
jgi:hypothetical protein